MFRIIGEIISPSIELARLRHEANQPNDMPIEDYENLNDMLAEIGGAIFSNLTSLRVKPVPSAQLSPSNSWS